jgi:phage shock protein A
MDLSNVSSEDLLVLADNVTRLKNLKNAIKEYEVYYMQVNEDYARVINEIADLEAKLKEVGL